MRSVFPPAAAYVNSSYLLTPAGGAVDTWADSCNFHQSSIRMNIECSFGMLVRRWGILWKPLEMRFNRMNKVIMSASSFTIYALTGVSVSTN